MGSRNHPFCQQAVLRKHKIRIFKKIIVLQEGKKLFKDNKQKNVLDEKKGEDILLEDQKWPTLNIVTVDRE